MISNNTIWQRLISESSVPNYYKGIKNIQFSYFKSKIDNNDYNFQEELINYIFDGYVIQFENALDNELIEFIKSEALKLSKLNVSNKCECIQGVNNYFYLQKDDQSVNGGYKAIDRSYYFFPWDKSSSELFDKINNYWSYIKHLGGQDKDEYNNNQPKDGIINRVHIIQYLTGGGTISPHNDPYDYQRIQIGSVMSEFGKDYKRGGFCTFDDKKRKIYLEPKLKKGSLICFFPSIVHSVDPIDSEEKLSFDEKSGRWYLSLGSVGSAHLKNRKKSNAVNI